MACVATDVGPLPEVVEHGVTGLLVPPRAVGPLAAALMRLASDPAEIGRLGATARKRALERFSLDRMVDGTIAAYRQALG